MPERRRLPLIPAAKVNPKKQTILAVSEDAAEPPIVGEAATGIEWLCGSCEQVLVNGTQPGQIQGIVIRCACGAYNDATI